MKEYHFLIFTFIVFINYCIYSQQTNITRVKTNKSQVSNLKQKYHCIKDTSEESIIERFHNIADEAETIMYAQVIAKESKYGSFNNEIFPGSYIERYTLVTFKVFQWLKGYIKGDEVTFDLPEKSVGDTLWGLSHTTDLYELNERAIFYLGNKKANTYLISKGKDKIFGWENGKDGSVIIGSWIIDAEEYVKLVKQSLANPNVNIDYVHKVKVAEAKHRNVKLKHKNEN